MRPLYDTAPLKPLSRTILTGCLSSFLLFCVLLPATALAQARPEASAAASAAARVTLITIGPGDEPWEKFGHNMLWINAPRRGFNRCYNWGLFDFDAPNFIGNFVLGRMEYSMDAFEPTEAMAVYYQQKRRVTMQPLALSPQQVDRMIDLCETNRLPANSTYRYDYFRDNCSTRVRDMIDRCTQGRLGDVLARAVPSGLTYRQHTMRLMQNDFWLSLGIDFSLGPRTDVPLTAAEECFLPMRLGDFASPLASETYSPWPTDRPPEPQAPPNRLPWMALAGVLIGGLTLAAARWRDWAGRWLVGLWWLISGLGGGFLIFAWLTDHWAAHANQNLLHISPLSFVALILLISRRRRPSARVAAAVIVISGVALLLHGVGLLGQANGAFIALALPLNCVAWRVVARPRLTPAPAASEVPAE